MRCSLRSRLITRSFSVVVKGNTSTRNIVQGSQLLANAVQLTLGPAGRTVVIDPFEARNYNALSVQP